MRVAYDANGYSYDIDTGYYLTLYWDEFGNAYDAATGEMIEEVITDSSGTTIYTGSGAGVDWEEIFRIAAQAYVGGQGAAQTGRYIPQSTQSPYGYETLSRPPQRPPTSVPTPMPGGGVGGSLNISTNTLMLIVGGFLLFMLGSKRGR